MKPICSPSLEPIFYFHMCGPFGLSYSFSSFFCQLGWSCQWILLRRVRKRGSRVKGLIGVTTPLPNARSLFFLTSLAAISEDGTSFSLSFYSCYSFNFFPIAACLASTKSYLPFAASTERLVWSIGYFLDESLNSLYKTVQETAQRCLRAN